MTKVSPRMAGIKMGWCCPLPCLRWLVILTTLVILCVGGLIVWLGRRLENEEFVKGVDFKWAALIIIAFGGFLIVVGFIGLAGAWYRTAWGLWPFILLLLMTTMVLITFSGLTLYVSQNVSDALDNEADCKGNHYLKDPNDATVLASQEICSPTCPCNASISVFGVDEYSNFTLGSATRIQDCKPCESQAPIMQHYKLQPGYCNKTAGNPQDYVNTFFSGTEQNYFALLVMLENEYNCTGICGNVPFFAFTNINRGLSNTDCRLDLQHWVQDYPLRYSAVVVAVSFFLFVNVISALCFVCHPRRRRKRSGKDEYESPPTNQA